MVLHRHGAYWGRRFAAPTRRGRSVRGAARRGNRATDRCVAGPELRVYRKRSSGTDHRARVDGDRLRLVPRVALSAAKPGAEASPSKVCAGQGGIGLARWAGRRLPCSLPDGLKAAFLSRTYGRTTHTIRPIPQVLALSHILLSQNSNMILFRFYSRIIVLSLF
jgi:hypothetical protein